MESQASAWEGRAQARKAGPNSPAKPGDRRSSQPVRAFHRQANLQTPTRAGVEDTMKPTIRRFAFLAFLFAVAVLSLQAQSDSPLARLSGTLVDSTGAGVSDVRIFAQPDASPNMAPLTTKSANDGSYSLNLPAGRYQLHFNHDSFVPRAFVFDFSAGQARTLDNIDKVEVVRGAESALYGTDAVSGVIQAFTHRGETRVPAVSLFTEGGSFSTVRSGAQLSGLLGSFDYSGAASYFTSDGQGPNDSFRNRTISG